MSPQDIKLLGVGSPLLDILINIEENFLKNINGKKGGMELIDISAIDSLLNRTNAERKIVPGGSAANTILALSTLGIKTGFLGKIGSDEEGDFYTNNYKEAGGDISRFKINPNIRTGQCLSLVTPDSERTMRTYLGAASTITPEDISREDFKDYTHLHIEGYMFHNREVIEKILTLSKEAGLKVSIDLASFEIVRDNMDILPKLIEKYVDIVFCNEDEASMYLHSTNYKNLFSELEHSCEIIALKLGKKGAIIYSKGTQVKIEPRLVEPLDTTGAGDLWQAGFLYGYLTCSTSNITELLETAGNYGSLLSSEIVKLLGASIPNERWDFLFKEIKQQY